MPVILFQPSRNLSPNHVPTTENILTISFQRSANHDPMPLKTLTILSHAPLNCSPNQFAVTENTCFIPDQISVNHFTAVFQALLMLSRALTNCALNHPPTSEYTFLILFQMSDRNLYSFVKQTEMKSPKSVITAIRPLILSLTASPMLARTPVIASHTLVAAPISPLDIC